MIKVLINGISGRMGQEVYKVIKGSSECEVVCGVDKIATEIDVPVYDNINDISGDIDVIIDFSLPEATMQILEYAKKTLVPIVIATTGFSKEQLEIIDNYSKEIPIFISSNMSYEINLMCEMVAKLAKQLTESDIEIVETHHRNKVDSPSGTALMLANSMNEALDNQMEYMYDRHATKQKRNNKEIGISSIRGGTEVGKHTVLFLGDNESFEITHTVTSRSIFAKGAVKAALFLVNKDKGLYNMKDLMN